MRVLLLCILFLSCSGWAQERLTLERCLHLAKQHNHQIRIAEEQAVQSRADFMEVNASKFPTLGISGQVSAQQEQAIDTAPLLESVPVALPFPSRFVLADAIQKQVVATFQVLLTTFGRVEHQIVAAFLKSEADQQNLLTEERKVLYQVKQAFVGVLNAAESAEVARLNLQSARAHHEQTEILLENGLVAKFELLKAQQSITENEAYLVEALKNEDLSRSNLLYLLNTDESLPAEHQPLTHIHLGEVSVAELATVAASRRPEMTVMKTTIRATEHLLKAAKAEMRPTLSFSVSQVRQDGSALAVTNQTQAVLSFQIPLYDGGVRKAKVKRAESSLRQLKIQEEMLVDGIALEVEQAWRDLLQTRSALRSAEAGLETAIESQRMAAIRYQNGISTSLEFEDAQRTLAAGRRKTVQARYQQDLAFAALENAIGFDLADREVSPQSIKSESDSGVVSEGDEA